jgi:hypothetical protein
MSDLVSTTEILLNIPCPATSNLVILLNDFEKFDAGIVQDLFYLFQ